MAITAVFFGTVWMACMWVVLAIVAIIAIAVVVGAMAADRYANYLGGVWVGDGAFLKKAGLSAMRLFIAAESSPDRAIGGRRGYLIVVGDDGATIADQPIDVWVGRRRMAAIPALFRARDDAYRVSFEMRGADAIPCSMAAVSIADGTLTLYDGDKLYAFLAKDAEASLVAAAAWDAASDDDAY